MSLDKITILFNQNIFVVSAGILLLGFIFGNFAKIFRLPRIAGYIIAGILFGPSIGRLFQDAAVRQLDFIPQFALGIIALVIGAGLSLNLIKKLGLPLIIITITQALGAFLFVLLILPLAGVSLEAALVLAAVATATAPAATVAVINEFRARGTFTETVLAVVALDDAIAIILFGLVLTFNPAYLASFGQGALLSLSASLIEISLALVIGIILGLAANFLARSSLESSDSIIIVLGMVMLSIGVSSVSHISALLTNMFLGLVFINVSSRNEEIINNLEKFAPPIYCMFFVLAGAQLDMKIFISGGSLLLFWSMFYFFARFAGKVSGAYIGGIFSSAFPAVKKYLGLTLLPTAGVAIGLILLIGKNSVYYEYRSLILNIALVTVPFTEIGGAILTKYALFKAGEAAIED